MVKVATPQFDYTEDKKVQWPAANPGRHALINPESTQLAESLLPSSLSAFTVILHKSYRQATWPAFKAHKLSQIVPQVPLYMTSTLPEWSP